MPSLTASSSLIRRIRLLPFPFSEQRRPLSAAIAAAASPDSFTVKFLTAHCNLPLAAAAAAARSIRIQESSSEASLAVLSLLRSHGFSPSHVARLVVRRPSLINARAGATLSPKLRFLSSFLPPSHLADVVVVDSTLLSRSLEDHIQPLFNLLRSFLGSPDEILVAVRRAPQILTRSFTNCIVPNVALLTSRGVPSSRIAKLFATHPRAFTVRAADFAGAVDISTSLGVGPDSYLFVHALRAVNGMRRSTWEARHQLFLRLGWTEEQFRFAFQRAPLIVLVSDGKIKKTVEFLTKEAQLTPSDLCRQPKLLMYSLERRLLPRFQVFQALIAKGLLKDPNGSKWKSSIRGLFSCTEQMFLHRFVHRHSLVAPELASIHNPDAGNEEAAGEKDAEGVRLDGSGVHQPAEAKEKKKKVT